MIQSFKMALKSISGNKMRSFLTMLGIIIGVMALVILVSLVNGTTSSVTDTINSLGSDMVGVSISDDYGKPIRIDDLDELMERPEVGAAAPVASGSMTGKYNSTSKTVTVTGTTEQYFNIRNIEIMIGRELKSSDYDNHTNVCVVNSTLAEELVGFTGCLNEEITLNGTRFTIIGVLKESTQQSLTSLLGGESLEAYIPYSSYVRLSTNTSNNITSFYVSASSTSTTEQTKNVVNQIMLERFNYDEDAFTIQSTDMFEDALGNVTAILSILLGGIAGISLVVGGIGIMNIMLVSVTERIREIGLRMAIGATPMNILMQFILEAVVLSTVGGAIGVLFGVGGAKIIGEVNHWPILIQPSSAAVAFLFSSFVGMFFGFYPAWRASRLNPIDCLRYE